MHLRRILSGATIAATMSVASLAHADIKDAEELFRQGKAEMTKGNYDKACPMFAESYKQDPAMGTLLNLALCHEAVGRIASAWGEWRAVEQQARAANPPREDRIKMAKEHAEKLEPRLSRIKILLPADARVDGLTIKIDGEAKGEPLWAGVPVDPGTRKVVVTAPGKKTLTRDVKIDDEGVVVSVTIPKLEDAPVTAPPPSAGTTVVGPDLEKVEEYAANHARRNVGFVVGGIGIATLAVGGVFGVAAIIIDGNAKDACPSPCIAGSTQASEADASTDRAFVFSNIANVTIPLGLIGAGIGAYLVLTAGPTEKKVSVTPMSSLHARGLSVTTWW